MASFKSLELIPMSRFPLPLILDSLTDLLIFTYFSVPIIEVHKLIPKGLRTKFKIEFFNLVFHSQLITKTISALSGRVS